MEKLGKYWGEDDTKASYQKQTVLDNFYEDVTYLDIIMDCQLFLNLTYAECLAWAQEKIDLVGESGLTPVEIRVANEHGLILGGV
jgi:hypothetical protein